MLLNKDRALKMMDKYGIDCLIATTPPNFTYMTDSGGCASAAWDKPLPTARDYVLFPRDGEPAVIINPGEASQASVSTWISDLRSVKGRILQAGPVADGVSLTKEEKTLNKVASRERKLNASEELVKLIRERGLDKGVIGMDAWGVNGALIGEFSVPFVLPWNVARHDRQYIEKELPKAKFFDAIRVFHEIRAVKSAEELKRVRTGCGIADKAMKAMVEAIKVGASELEIMRAYNSVVVQYDGWPCWGNVNGGRRSAFANVFPTEYQVKRGDLIHLEAGFRYKLYHTDVGRSYILGPPTSSWQKKCVDEVTEAVYRGVEALRPGLKVSELFSIMNTDFRKVFPDTVGRCVGHGIGLEIHELPWVDAESKFTLLPNMIMSVEASHWQLGFGGIHYEDNILITETGHEYLTKPTKDLVLS
jgi:Xaa-Pro aminopeptidase